MTKARKLGLSGLPWYGGKSPMASQGTGEWIASLIPNDTNVAYIEPFGGMFGVGLNRPKSDVEIYNDLNGRAVNWWRTVIMHPLIFGYMLEHMPASRQNFEDAIEWMDNPEYDESSAKEIVAAAGLAGVEMPEEEFVKILRAFWFHELVWQNVKHGDVATPGNWQRPWTASYIPWRSPRIEGLAERMREVTLENMDAVEFLKKCAEASNATDQLIYCDPPYRTSDVSSYSEKGTDWDALAEVLKEQKGRVAISGYGEEWDMLGWEKKTRGTHRATLVKGKGVEVTPRTECLWANYALNAQPRLEGF